MDIIKVHLIGFIAGPNLKLNYHSYLLEMILGSGVQFASPLFSSSYKICAFEKKLKNVIYYIKKRRELLYFKFNIISNFFWILHTHVRICGN